MMRAGLIHPFRAGVFQFLPLGFRCLQKVERICQEELQAAGFLPTLWPDDASTDQLLAGLEVAYVANPPFAPLPLKLFQILPRSWDVPKPRAGLLDACESVNCEAFSYREKDDPDPDTVIPLLERILRRCGVPFLAADDIATVGRESAVAYFSLTEAGRDWVFRSDKGNYAATDEQAQSGIRPWTFSGDPFGELEKVHTPGLISVREVAEFLKVPNSQVLKTLVFRTDATGPSLASGVNPKWVVAVVRGDHSVNRRKLHAAISDAFRVGLMASADEGDLPDLGEQWVKGFVGPDAAMRKPDAVLVVDYDAAANVPWIAGANERNYHVRPFHWFRECGDRLADARKTVVADVRDARDGDPSPLNDGGRLVAGRCVAVARSLRYEPISRQIDARAFEIDLGRVLGAVVEHLHDDRGILWPAPIAPFTAVVTALGYKGDTKVASDRIYEQLTAAGIDTILDDRDASPGMKFADADLIGFPVRVTIGQRGLKEAVVEVKARGNAEGVRVPVDAVVEAVRVAMG